MPDYLRFFPKELVAAGEPDRIDEWWSWRGMSVHLERLPDPAAQLKLIALHGAGGYGRMLLTYGQLVNRGVPVEVVAPDLPGYGSTRTNGMPFTYPDWVDCASELIEAERKRDGLPIIVLGGSLGGMLAYSATARSGAAGLIVTCLLDPRRAEVRAAAARYPLLAKLPPAGMRPLDGLSIPIKWIAKMSAMSNNPELNSVVAADRLGGGNKVPLRFLRTYLSSQPEIEPEHFTTCPVLMVHPDADTWTPLALSQPFFDRLPVNKQLVRLENCGHMPIEQPGLTQMTTAVQEFIRRQGHR